MVFSNGDTYAGDWVDGKRTGERASNKKKNDFSILVAEPCDRISSGLAWPAAPECYIVPPTRFHARKLKI